MKNGTKDAVKRVARILDRANFILIAALAMVMGFSVFIQIVARNVFSVSFEVLEELPRFGLIWITFFGSAMVYKEAGHLGIEFLVNALPPKAKRAAWTAATICNALFFALLVGAGMSIARLTMVQKSLQLGIPIGIVYAAIPASGILMLIYMLEKLLSMNRPER